MITEFGKELRKIRIDKNLVLKNMADDLDFSSSYLSAIECGKRKIPDDIITRLSAIYDLSEEEIDDLKNSKNKSSENLVININNISTEKRNLALQFARRFDDIDDDTANNIVLYLKNKSGE
jgi:transcriptional regulator with XRE-family HTH domain